MSTAFLHKVVLVCIVYKNNNLLPGYILGSHVDSRFRLAITFDYALNIVDVLCLEGREGFFDFENIFDIAAYLRSLYV